MRKSRRVLAVLLAAVIVLAAGMPVGKGKAADFEASKPSLSTADSTAPLEVKPGETINVRIPVKAHGFTVRKPVFVMDFETGNLPFELVSDVTLERDDVKDNTTITNIVMYKVTYLCFQLKVKESARKKEYSDIPISVITTDSFNDYYKLNLEYAVPFTIKVTSEKALPSFKIISQSFPESVKAEDDFDVNLTFQNMGEIAAQEVQIGLTTEGNVFIPKALYNTLELGTVKAGGRADTMFSFTASKTMDSGVKQVTANVKFKLEDGTEMTEDVSFYIETEGKDGTTSVENSDVQLVKSSYPKQIRAGQDVAVKLRYQNKSKETVTNVKVQLAGFKEAELLPNFVYDTVELGTLESGKNGTAEFSLTAAQNITTGTKELTAKVTYTTSTGSTYTSSVPLLVEGGETKPVTNTDVRLVRSSYPKQISAEQNVSIQLEYRNNGSQKVTGVEVQLTGYKEAELLPNFVYDTVSLGELDPGKSATAAFSLTAGKYVTSGTKEVIAKVTYTTADGGTYDSTVSLLMEGLMNEVLVANSMPKLIIQNYEVGTEKLMAGAEFDFAFDVLNSHSSARADNIKVTISSQDNNFSIVEGSSSFLIPFLEAGGTEHCEIPLRVKGDAATGGYDLSVTFEYEYAAKDENKNDVSKSNTIEEKLKIPVYSNDRPMVSNIMVGYYEPPKVGELTTMSFEFYNMGKAILYNVTATLEGDFDSAGQMLVIGNVEPGAGKSWEMDVTPMVEGMGSGILHISYEDSNGNISTFDESFEQTVDSANAGMDDPSIYDPGMFDPTGGDGISEAKKEILPLVAFIPAEIVLFLVLVLLTKTIAIRSYKKKKLKGLEDED